MNNKQFEEVVIFFNDETGCGDRVARKLAGYVDNIVFNAKRDDEEFIKLVAFGLRNAYFEGEMRGEGRGNY